MIQTDSLPSHIAKEAEHASKLSRSFVRQYYECLNASTETLSKFYGANSIFCISDESKSATIVGADAICERFVTDGFKGVHVDLEHGSFDCMPSVTGGVSILLTGYMTFQSGECKFFVQSFRLSKVDSEFYYVVNDILRFPSLPASNAAAATPAPEIPVEQEKAEAVVEEPVAPVEEEPAPVVEEPVAAQEPAVPEPAPVAEEEPATPEPVVEEAAAPAAPEPEVVATEPEAPVVEEPVKEDTGPRSWASIAARKIAAPTPAAPKPAAAPVAAPAAAAAAPKAKPAAAPAAEPTSLVLKGLPAGVNNRMLDEAFGKFGKMKIIMQQDRQSAFINYQTPEAVQKALAESDMMVNGAKISAEPRLVSKSARGPNTRSNSNGGRARGSNSRNSRSRNNKDRSKQ